MAEGSLTLSQLHQQQQQQGRDHSAVRSIQSRKDSVLGARTEEVLGTLRALVLQVEIGTLVGSPQQQNESAGETSPGRGRRRSRLSTSFAHGGAAGGAAPRLDEVQRRRWLQDIQLAIRLLEAPEIRGIVADVDAAAPDGVQIVERGKVRRLSGSSSSLAPSTSPPDPQTDWSEAGLTQALVPTAAPGQAKMREWFMRVRAADPLLSLPQLAAECPDVEPVAFVAGAVFGYHGLGISCSIDVDRVRALAEELSASYLANPFHNALHAADVLFVCHLIFVHGSETSALGKASPWERVAFFLAAMAHDVGHPGVTNSFLVASRDALAVTYNDRSVLENFHAAEAVRLLQSRPWTNVFGDCGAQEFNALRGLVVDLILSTDMASHFALLQSLDAVCARPSGLRLLARHLTAQLAPRVHRPPGP